MALPEFSMRQLLEAGAHFGHQTHRWNPKMERYIFGSRSNIHIIDLSQSIPLLHQALVKVREVAAAGGRVLFVGTKRQASEPVATAAKRCAQYYVNHRWLGGTLTNWRTISGSIARLRELEGLLDGDGDGRTKKELLQLTRERDKLELSLGGIKDMGGIPDLMFVIDTNKEAIAIQEARKLNIPVIAILDTNCDPDGITYPDPGQRRRRARHPALLRPDRRRRPGRPGRRPVGLGRRPGRLGSSGRADAGPRADAGTGRPKPRRRRRRKPRPLEAALTGRRRPKPPPREAAGGRSDAADGRAKTRPAERASRPSLTQTVMRPGPNRGPPSAFKI